MKPLSIQPDEDVLKKFLLALELLIESFELNQGDVFTFACMYSVFASDQLKLNRNDFLLNASNFWDMYSKYSTAFHRKDMQ